MADFETPPATVHVPAEYPLSNVCEVSSLLPLRLLLYVDKAVAESREVWTFLALHADPEEDVPPFEVLVTQRFFELPYREKKAKLHAGGRYLVEVRLDEESDDLRTRTRLLQLLTARGVPIKHGE